VHTEDLADLEDRAALAAHYAARLAGRDGVPLADLDAALDQMDAGQREDVVAGVLRGQGRSTGR
jgi:hypothetical protein